MNKIIKWILTPLFIIFILYFGYRIFVFVAFDGLFDRTVYTKKDLIENYKSKQNQIVELENYFKSIIPNNKGVSIEFENQKLSIYHILNEEGKRDSNWNLKLKSKKVDSLNEALGWNREILTELKSKLDKANCVSIESGNPTTIGFKRSEMGMYFYKVFNKKLSDSLILEYNDGCNYSFFKDNIVLEYGGGAIGPNCFEDFVRK